MEIARQLLAVRPTPASAPAEGELELRAAHTVLAARGLYDRHRARCEELAARRDLCCDDLSCEERAALARKILEER